MTELQSLKASSQYQFENESKYLNYKTGNSILVKSLNFDNGGLTEPYGEIWIISINAGHKIKLSMTDSYLGQNSRQRFP